MSSLKYRNYRIIDSVLESIKMEKYKEIFHQKIMNWDMFVQMSLDDLKKIGVEDEDDRNLIYNELRATAEAMRDKNSENAEMVLANCVRHVKEVARSLLMIKKGAESVSENEAIDCSHSAASAVVFLCERAFKSASLIQSDFKQIAQIRPEPKKKTKLILGTLIVASICFVLRNRLSTVLLQNYKNIIQIN